MKRSKKQFHFIITLFALTTLACNQPEKSDHQDQIKAENDGKALQERALLIGLIPEQSIFEQLERYEPLAAYLSQKIEREIELKILTQYGDIVDNFISLELDGAFFGSFTYALAHKKIGVKVLARPENMKGISTYRGYIFVRKDSGIRNIRDMKGKRFVFVDKATTAGFLLPLTFFKQNGISDYKAFFRETYFSGTHWDAISDVLRNRADVGAAKNTVFNRLAKTDSSVMDQLLVLEESPNVPENGLALRNDLDAALASKMSEALLQMHHDTDGARVLRKFGARRFVKTTHDDYKVVFDYVKQVHLDLNSYNYQEKNDR